MQPGCTKLGRCQKQAEFQEEVAKELTGKDSEPSELIYCKVCRSRLPVIEQAIGTAAFAAGLPQVPGLLPGDDLFGLLGRGQVDARGTSQTCVYGRRVPRTLADRWHDCAACGLSESSDHVSVPVILPGAGTQPSGANVEVVISCVS